LPGNGAAPFLAIDVGGSSVKSALVVNEKVEHPSREPVADDLDGLVRQIVRLCEAADAPSWGLCIAGIVDPQLGIMRNSANLGLQDAPIVELLTAELSAPKVFVNDLVAATVGEADGRTLALLQIGTGIAARCAVEGSVSSSATGHAGEVGHLRFRAGGRPCRCGNRGCAEAYGAWGGIADRYAEAGRPATTPATLLQEAQADDWARKVLDDALDAIGFAASALVAACDPGTLRVGGGVAAAWGETLLEAIRTALKEQVLPKVAAATVVESARLGDSAALLGLAALARSAT
jgi:predicted NBD/HSP70 family sugar kinase